MDVKHYIVKDNKVITIPSSKELCEIISEKFQVQERQIEYYKDELRKVQSETYKDETVAKLKEIIIEQERRLLNGFGIWDKEMDKIQDWMKNHNHKEGSKFFTYTFCPTAIGTTGTITCSCGESFQFRDIE